MLKASQKRTKRAPFTEELMSKQPEITTQKYINTAHIMLFWDSTFTFHTIIHVFCVRLTHFSLTRSHFGLVTHNPHCASVHAGKSNHDVLRIVGHDLKEVSLVRYLNRRTKTDSVTWYEWHGSSCSCSRTHQSILLEWCPTCHRLWLTQMEQWCQAKVPGDHWKKQKHKNICLPLKTGGSVKWTWWWWVTWGRGTPLQAEHLDCLVAGSWRTRAD